MFILAVGENDNRFADFKWLAEGNIEYILARFEKVKSNKIFENKILIMFALKSYTNNRTKDIVELKGAL